MTKDELKRLNRVELLELLLDQAKIIEKLEQELAETRAQLESRQIKISEAGSLAQAALQINEVFSRADAAAKQYLENSMAQADKLLQEATEESERKKQDADDYWSMISDRMERFYQDHAWLREMLDARMNDAGIQRSAQSEEI